MVYSNDASICIKKFVVRGSEGFVDVVPNRDPEFSGGHKTED